MENLIKKRILVYDSSNGFLRFIKDHYSDKFIIDTYIKKPGFEVYNKNNKYLFGFIIISEFDDLMYVKFIESKVKHVFIVSSKKDLNEIQFDSDSISFLDSFKLKSEIIAEINNNLNLTNLN